VTYVIAEPCINVKDKGCVDVCPTDCIHGTDDDRMLYIDPEDCIDCGACVPVCPVEAIFAEAELPEKWRHFTQVNIDYFKSKREA
jgi:ferredoxin